MDFITDFPLLKLGKNIFDSILVIMNRYTKLLKYIPVNKVIIVLELTEIMFKHIFKDFGILKDIISDRGFVFISNF